MSERIIQYSLRNINYHKKKKKYIKNKQNKNGFEKGWKGHIKQHNKKS